MSQPRRIQSENILFHIINRGNAKQPLFYDDADRQLFLELLRRYKLKYQLRVYHYVLMTNHIHLLLEPTIPQTISKFMQGLTGAYAQRFNQKYRSVGHVWQSRFRSIPIETDSYYIRCAQYIELNPVRAGIVEHPSGYAWSSYAQSARLLSNQWLDVQPLLRELQIRQIDGTLMYNSLIDQELEKIREQKQECLTQFAIYGGTDFMSRFAPLLEKSGSEAGLRPS